MNLDVDWFNDELQVWVAGSGVVLIFRAHPPRQVSPTSSPAAVQFLGRPIGVHFFSAVCSAASISTWGENATGQGTGGGALRDKRLHPRTTEFHPTRSTT